MLSPDLKVRLELLNLGCEAFNDPPLLIHFGLISLRPLTSSLKLCVYHPKLLVPTKPQSLTSLQAFASRSFLLHHFFHFS